MCMCVCVCVCVCVTVYVCVCVRKREGESMCGNKTGSSIGILLDKAACSVSL